MSGFLVSSKDECCCPEMRCCTPETVTATVAGMSGQTVRGYVSLGDLSYLSRGSGEIICAPGRPVFVHSAFDAFVLMGMPSRFRYSTIQTMASCGGGEYWTYWENTVNPWPPSAFPPVAAALVQIVEDPYEGLVEQTTDFQWAWNGIYTVPDDIELRWTTFRSICESAELLCNRPDPSGLHSGPCQGVNGLSPAIISNENDLNGTYVCHRPDQYLRPALKCRITRRVPLTQNGNVVGDSPYNGVTEAALLYNVDPRRTWVFKPPPYECWDVMFPPEGEEYCVDYRCGKRNPWYSAGGFGYCVRGKCTVTNQGVVKPHLYYYHDGLQTATSIDDILQSQSANLYLKLIPKDYEVDEHGRFPTWWQVGSVDIIDGGYGYEVGQFFQVDFDIRRPWLGGEIMTVFPKFDMSCMPPYYPTWIDKYGYAGTEVTLPSGIPAAKLYQRLRIAAVDDNGAITQIEVVPIYKQPEFSDPPFCNDEKVGDERTKFYVGYGRVLCHPRSVQLPGIGYTVGDQIEFYCDDPPCETVEPAIAVVSDVDEEGGILDWRIRGSDFPFGYATAYSCDETDGAGNCIASCFDRMPGSEPDQRGKYRWKARLLCDLTWTGVGVPARAASLPTSAFSAKVADYDHPWTHPTANLSGLTTLTLRLGRTSCETSIEVLVSQWPFGATLENSSDLGITRLLYLWPPYPACHGGGAVVKPVFGAWGANESDFGSSLVGAQVQAGGAGYCYREKRHVEPTLPLNVPAMGGGTGATIAAFQFSAKHNFPNPAAQYGDTPPASDRFSYFPVTGATIDQPGAGYVVGQEFEVSPAGGRAVSDMWKGSGGDNPEQCPNGAWYGGERALVNDQGYRPLAYNAATGQWQEPVHTEPSVCRLRVASVSQTGGISGLEVVHGGMMFKTEYTVGRKNPLAYIWLQSTLGYGAYITATFNETWGSSTFGEVLNVDVVGQPNVPDPKHPGVPNGLGGWLEPPGLMPIGGRDYADRSAGYFWMLQNTAVGGPVCPTWGLLAHLGWHGRPLTNFEITGEPNSPLNFNHDNYSTHTVIAGQAPPFIAPSTVCAFSDCYHDLLTRQYPLVKVWGGACLQNGVDGIGGPRMPVSNGGHAVLRRKGRTAETAKGSDFVVVEYGPTLTLNYTPSSPCPDHSNGTTTRE